MFVKGYGFLSFNKIMGKNNGKILSSKYSQKLLDHAKQSATDALKMIQKKQFKKQLNKLLIWLLIKLLIKLQKSQKIRRKILQIQLEVKRKYLEKDIYLHKKDRKLLMN